MFSVTLKVQAPRTDKNSILSQGLNYLREIRQWEGCTGLQMFRDIENGNGFYVISEWKTAKIVERYLRDGLFDRLRKQLSRLHMPVEINYHIVTKELLERPVLDDIDQDRPRGNKLFFLGNFRKKPSGQKSSVPKDKYAGSTISAEQIEAYQQQIIDYMETQKPYLDKNLTLTKFGKEVGISPHQVSRVINEKMGLNFSNFINRYRVNYSKQFLKEDFLSTYTISSIGYESGFNSRSSFYSSFKKFMGMSPGDYLSRQRTSEKPVVPLRTAV